MGADFVATHKCEQKADILELKQTMKVVVARLGDGEVTFAHIDEKLDRLSDTQTQTLAQATKTNGRVTKHDRLIFIIGGVIIGLGLTQSSGIFPKLLEILTK